MTAKRSDARNAVWSLHWSCVSDTQSDASAAVAPMRAACVFRVRVYGSGFGISGGFRETVQDEEPVQGFERVEG